MTNTLEDVDAMNSVPNAVDQDVFRNVMARVVTPVAVVTSLSDAGPHGTTVGAFASLSMEPPMVVVSLSRTSELLSVVLKSGRFGINVLDSHHAHWASAFASKRGSAKFDGVPWSVSHDLPRLEESTWIACRLAGSTDGGDHILLLGHVVAAEHSDSPPLTFHRRTFGTHVDHLDPR